MRDAGRLLSRVFAMLDSVISPGISTMEINDRAEAFIVGQLRARPASKGQYNYPYALNTSVNDAVCHGLPHQSLRLRNGDIVNVDITLEKSGYIADASKMYMVGRVTPRAKNWCSVAITPCGRVSAPSNPAQHWAISATRYRTMQSVKDSVLYANTVATALAGKCTRNPRYCTMAVPAPGLSCARG